jgi:ABC-type sugar transport system permease subunit
MTASIKGKKAAHTLRPEQRRFLLLVLVPAMVLFMTFTILPILMTVALSLFNYNPMRVGMRFVSLGNYAELFSDPIFMRTMKNTAGFVTAAVGVNLVLSLALGLAIHSVVNRGLRDAYRTLYFMPVVTPVVAGAIIWKMILNPGFGLITTLLHYTGYDNIIYWLTDPKLAMFSVITMTLWQDLGYNVLLISTGLLGIPQMFFEAARCDGANEWQVILSVKLPLLARTFFFVSIMTVISYFQMFTQARVMTNGGPSGATEVIALAIYRSAFENNRMGYASAMSVVLLMIILAVSLVQMRINRVDWEY